MENDTYREPAETFEDVIQVFTHFKNCVLNLTERYNELLYHDSYFRNYAIEDKLHRHLKNSQNVQTLNNYINLFRRITDKKIKEALPDGWMNNEPVMAFTNNEEEKHQEEEKTRQKIKEQIDKTTAFITGILERYKTVIPKTKYIDNAFKPKIKHQMVKAFETALVKNQLIDPHTDFLKVFRGQSPDERINWIGSTSSFKYFIDELFKIEPLKDEKNKWVAASSTFTIEGKPLPITIRTYKEIDVSRKIKILINTAISYLID